MSLASRQRINTPVFRVLLGQLPDTYFRLYKEDEDQRERDEVLKVNVFNSSSPESSIGSDTSGKDSFAFAITRRKRERKKTHATKATKKLFEPLSKHVVDRSNKLNKGHLLCMKWYSAAKKAQGLSF
eukprot:jgi/Psemu1/53005/gm1.53005_g